MFKNLAIALVILSSLSPISKSHASIESDLRASYDDLNGLRVEFAKSADENHMTATACIIGTCTLAAWCFGAPASGLHHTGNLYDASEYQCKKILKDLNEIITFLDAVEKAFAQLMTSENQRINWGYFSESFKTEVAKYINLNYGTFERAITAIHTCNQSGLSRLISDEEMPKKKEIRHGHDYVECNIPPMNITAPVNYTSFVKNAIMQEMNNKPNLGQIGVQPSLIERNPVQPTSNQVRAHVHSSDRGTKKNRNSSNKPASTETKKPAEPTDTNQAAEPSDPAPLEQNQDPLPSAPHSMEPSSTKQFES